MSSFKQVTNINLVRDSSKSKKFEEVVMHSIADL